MGSTLNLLDITDNIVGGQVTVTGQTVDKTGKQVVAGHIEGADYSLVRAPVFARILSLLRSAAPAACSPARASRSAPCAAIFAYGEDRLVLDNLVAYGGAIGVTSNGVADLGRDRSTCKGRIVPAYALNSILGIVPVFGPLLLGGKGRACSPPITGSPDRQPTRRSRSIR